MRDAVRIAIRQDQSQYQYKHQHQHKSEDPSKDSAKLLVFVVDGPVQITKAGHIAIVLVFANANHVEIVGFGVVVFGSNGIIN